MDVAHKVGITYDETTKKLVIRHYGTTTIANHVITRHDDVELTPESEKALVGFLTSVIDSNRAEVATRCSTSAVVHVAAVTDKKGLDKVLQFGGTIEPQGNANQTKN